VSIPTVAELAGEIEEIFNSPEDERTGALMKLVEDAYREGYGDCKIEEDTEMFARAFIILRELNAKPIERVTNFASRFSKDDLQDVADFLADVVAAKTEL
jgi:hypothetical protein